MLKTLLLLIKARKSIINFLESPSLASWEQLADVTIAHNVTVSKALVAYSPKFAQEQGASGWKSFPDPEILGRSIRAFFTSGKQTLQKDTAYLEKVIKGLLGK